jgi:hypothetical protein
MSSTYSEPFTKYYIKVHVILGLGERKDHLRNTLINLAGKTALRKIFGRPGLDVY